MNITELARRLKVAPNELKEKLPELGFSIGRKAIQIPDQQAKKVIERWGKIEAEKRKEERLKKINQKEQEEEKEEEIKEAYLPPSIQVYRLAEELKLPLNKVMSELIKNGVLTGLNEKIDYEIAAIVAENLGFKVKLREREEKVKVSIKEKIKEIIKKKKKKALVARPPVVVVVGHVDHGKSLLLSRIRQIQMAEEKGGITQKIGAYQVEKNNRLITFVDTPGHEAFETMRERGGETADLAILVIAADDNIQPQTLESIKIISKENLPFLVAINKIDKEGADVEKIKKELSEINLVPEGWGGKTVCVPVSARTGEGVDDLLENLLLLADLNEEVLLADEEGKTAATVIESHIDPGFGATATVIVFNGSLRKGDLVIIGGSYGKIKNMKDENNEDVTEANLSQPVQIFGLKSIPQVGEILEVIKNLKEFKKKVKKLEILSFKRQLVAEEKKGENKNLKIILRTDTTGSQEAVVGALENLGEEDIKIEIIKKGLGKPTEADIVLAQKLDARVFGFNVDFPVSVRVLAKELKVKINFYDVIYTLIEEIKEEVESLIGPKIVEETQGKIKILSVFSKSKKGIICGGRVTEGIIASGSLARIWRDSKIIGEAKIKNLQIHKEDIKQAKKGVECGILLSTDGEIQEGNILEVYIKKEVRRVKALS